MEFLDKVDTFYIEIGLLIVFAIGYFFVQRKNNLKSMLQYLLFSYGIAILLLTLTIPHVFPGYPYDVSDVENKKRLLFHLQRNNEALVQTTEAFRTMAFLTFLFLVSVISLKSSTILILKRRCNKFYSLIFTRLSNTFSTSFKHNPLAFSKIK
ncbi:hypothetical protein WFZ85_06215 [Flavobacterium sp. j3]|uniref:BlaR1 peptidase M56 n=1 Tax=Flavobacterium aureirubrum TaxID=3133147 RepID=A0ABU9N3A6_9FLAO